MSAYEKNWSPFLYNESLYFVYRVLPLEVIYFTDYYYTPKNRYYHTHGFLSVKMNLTSLDKCSQMNYKDGLSWAYGKIRGGTPLYLIQDVGYVGFFHSLLPSCDYNYFFGAYVISSHPPFKILKMSHQPIISNDVLVMHTGNQYKSVIFPMSYYMLDHDKKILDTKTNIYISNISSIVVAAGYADSVGYIIHLDITMLLNSMTDMVDSC
uniref:Uncharacterized protein n=1 Tax=Chromulina nebulosa TaxID=96789 RepID=A0A7S0SVW3_9STRA